VIVYNDCLDENRIRRRLDDLTERIFGEGSRWYAVDSLVCCNQRFYIDIDSKNKIEVEDITDMVDTGKVHTQFFIMVNEEHSKFRWIVTQHRIQF